MTNLDNYLQIYNDENHFRVEYETVDLEIDTDFRGVDRVEGDGYHYPKTHNPEVEIVIEEVRLRTENTDENKLPKINFCKSLQYELATILEAWAIENVELEEELNELIYKKSLC